MWCRLKQPIGCINIPYILMPYIFASCQLGIFSCAKNTRLLNFWWGYSSWKAMGTLLKTKIQGCDLDPRPCQQFFYPGLQNYQPGALSQGNSKSPVPISFYGRTLLKVLIPGINIGWVHTEQDYYCYYLNVLFLSSK